MVLGVLEGDELLAIGPLEGDVVLALVAEGRDFTGAHVEAADGVGAVGGVNDDAIAERDERPEDALVKEGCTVRDEIGAADVADEEGVAGEDGHGIVAGGEVGEGYRDALGGVAGGFWRRSHSRVGDR